MPRTFNLQRLFLAVTIVCVLVGIAVNFPVASLAICAVAGWFVPALAVSFFLSFFSSQPRVTLGMAMGAGLAGFILCMPAVFAITVHGMGAGTWWQAYANYYLLLATPAAFCALVFGSAWCVDRPR